MPIRLAVVILGVLLVSTGAVAADKQYFDVRVRGLDDPVNPHREAYTQWDRWAFERITSWPADDLLTWEGPPAEKPAFYDNGASAFQAIIELDEQGFPIPLAESWQAEARRPLDWDVRQYSRQFSEHGNDPVPGVKWPTRVCAYERVRLAAEFENAHQLVLRKAYPPVPPELSAQPVFQTVALPDGTFCTFGEPGSAILDFNGHYMPAAAWNVWHHYDSAGKFVEKAQYIKDAFGNERSPNQWVQFTFPGFLALWQRETDAGHTISVNNGYTLVWSSPGIVGADLTGTIGSLAQSVEFFYAPMDLLAAYDWDGTPLPLDEPLTRPEGYCVEMSWELVSAFLPEELDLHVPPRKPNAAWP